MMGVTPAEVASLCREQLQPRPLAYGANCGVGPVGAGGDAPQAYAAARPGDVIVAKGNCGVPYFVDGKIRYDGTPEHDGRSMPASPATAGARIIGGCCGTTPGHLAAIRAALDGYEPGERPTIEQVIELSGQDLAGGGGHCTPCREQRCGASPRAPQGIGGLTPAQQSAGMKILWELFTIMFI